jgi:uncharacterized protein (TIGR00255 family)
MSRSMTAYANAEAQLAQGQIRVEIRSVNHRFLELGVKIPEELRALEPQIRERVQARVQRGKLDLNVRYKAEPGQGGLRLNQTVIDSLIRIADDLHNRNPELKPLSTADVLAWPGAVEGNDSDTEALKSEVVRVIDSLLKSFDEARVREGEKLAATLLDKVAQIADIRTQALGMMPLIRQNLQERLRAKVAEFQESLEPNRIEAELVMYLNKMDVDEELERLRIHLEEISRVLKLREPIGKRLDFLVQELHRECTTFGNKSIDARTSQMGVDLKVLVEQIREQVQNLE